jgi:hypothetical protein
MNSSYGYVVLPVTQASRHIIPADAKASTETLNINTCIRGFNLSLTVL